MGRKWNKKDDNRGFSTVLVLTVMVCVVIMGVILLSLTLATFRMKATYSNSQKNFYDAESVLDDINTGLQKDVADAAGEAYAYMLEHYSGATEDQRLQYYSDEFDDQIRELVASNYADYQAGGLKYSLDHLNNMISDEVKNGAENRDSAASPLLSCADGTCTINEDYTAGTITLKNVQVIYIDERDYMTKILTDIEIACPPLDMDPTAVSPLDLPSYTIVANNQTVVNDAGTKTITGNAYLGDAGTNFSLGTIKFNPTATAGKITTAGELYVRNQAQVTVGEDISLWAKEVHVDSAKSLELKGTSYINDDVVIDNSIGVSDVGVSLAGRFYAYGNPESATLSRCFGENAADMEDLTKNPASYSSAVLINGRNVTLDMSKLDDLILSGTAYVGSEKAANAKTNGNSNVQMGESVALKTSQRAYLVPSEFLAPYCAAGGRNPMSESTYTTLLQEIVSKRSDYTSTSQVKDLDFIRYDADASADIPEELQNLHVKGVKKQVYQISTGSGNVIKMVYFFLVFETEEDAINYGNSKYAESTADLEARLDTQHYNTKITYPSMMYDEFAKNKDRINDFNFYYNGSLIVPANARTNTEVRIGQRTTASSQTAAALSQREQEYQNMFAAMKHTLLSDYNQLKSSQKTTNLYNNLVETDRLAGVSNKKVFTTGRDGVAAESQMAALVVNGDYTLTGTADDAMEEGYPVHLVLASGDVTVDCNYRGLIIAGGDIKLTLRAEKVSANASMVQKALQIEDDTGDHPYDYLIDGITYLSSMGGSMDGESSETRYADYVTYSNWSKQ
jgi:hypothetical protein